MKRIHVCVAILLTFFFACSSDKNGESKSQQAKIKIPAKAVFTLAWSKQTARHRYTGEGSNRSSHGVYRQDPEMIKNSIITRLGNKGYSLVQSPKSGISTDGILKVNYKESLSSVAHWGDTQYQMNISLKDSAGNTLLNLGKSRIVWEWTDSTLFDFRNLPELVDLAWQKQDLFDFYNQFITEQRYLTRVVDILAASNDSRAIDVLTPLLRYDGDALRSNARKALVTLGFRPKTAEHKAAMEIIRLSRTGGQVNRGIKVSSQ